MEDKKNINNENSMLATAKLNNCPTSPRKMRIVADLLRGKMLMLLLISVSLVKKMHLENLKSYFYLQFQTGK